MVQLGELKRFMTEHILYSFRRCPYAIRARMALAYAGIQCELRELLLKDKPQDMLKHSPKGTVPVLITKEGDVVDESLDVMLWALKQHDPDDWFKNSSQCLSLIHTHDTDFKPLLDCYKYADRHPELSLEEHQANTLPFVSMLNDILSSQQFLIDDQISLADTSLFPFIRQYAHVNKSWFEQLPMAHLQAWLNYMLNSSLFQKVMLKYKLYNDGFHYTFP